MVTSIIPFINDISITKAELELKGVYLSLGNTNMINLYNSNEYFGFDDWDFGVEKEISGLVEKIDSSPMPKGGDEIRLLMRLDQSQLKVAGVFFTMNFSETYPSNVELDTDGITFTKR